MNKIFSLFTLIILNSSLNSQEFKSNDFEIYTRSYFPIKNLKAVNNELVRVYDTVEFTFYNFKAYFEGDSFIRKRYDYLNSLISTRLDFIDNMIENADKLKFNTKNVNVQVFVFFKELLKDNRIPNLYKLKIMHLFTKHINDLIWQETALELLTNQNCATFPYEEFTDDVYRWAMKDNQIHGNEVGLIGKYKVYKLKDSLNKFFIEYNNPKPRFKNEDDAKLFHTKLTPYEVELEKDPFHILSALGNLGDTIAENLFVQKTEQFLGYDSYRLYSLKNLEVYKKIVRVDFPILKSKLKADPPCYYDSVKRKNGDCGWPYSFDDRDLKMLSVRNVLGEIFCYECGNDCKWLKKVDYNEYDYRTFDAYDEYLLGNLNILIDKIKNK